MNTTLATQSDVMPPPGMGEFRRKALAVFVSVAAPLGALAACGGDGGPDVRTEVAAADDQSADTPRTTGDETTTTTTSSNGLVDLICAADYFESDGSYNDHLYTAMAKRTGNCTSKDFVGSGPYLGITFFEETVPAGGPIDAATYCDEGTVFTQPVAAFGEDWVVEAMPTEGASPLFEDRQAFMEALAEEAGGEVWVGSCPANAEIEADYLQDSGNIQAPEPTPTTAEAPSDPPATEVIPWEPGMTLTAGTDYCVEGAVMYAESDGEGGLALYPAIDDATC